MRKRGLAPFVQSTRRTAPAKGACPLFPGTCLLEMNGVGNRHLTTAGFSSRRSSRVLLARHLRCRSLGPGYRRRGSPSSPRSVCSRLGTTDGCRSAVPASFSGASSETARADRPRWQPRRQAHRRIDARGPAPLLPCRGPFADRILPSLPIGSDSDALVCGGPVQSKWDLRQRSASSQEAAAHWRQNIDR